MKRRNLDKKWMRAGNYKTYMEFISQKHPNPSQWCVMKFKWITLCWKPPTINSSFIIIRITSTGYNPSSMFMTLSSSSLTSLSLACLSAYFLFTATCLASELASSGRSPSSPITNLYLSWFSKPSWSGSLVLLLGDGNIRLVNTCYCLGEGSKKKRKTN